MPRQPLAKRGRGPYERLMTTATAPALRPDATLDEMRPALARALAPHAAFDGWTEAALAAAARDLGIAPDVAALAFSGGAMDMIDAYIADADSRLAAACPPEKLASLKIRDRITCLVRTRLTQATADKEALRRALAIMALPQNGLKSMHILWRTADHMWRLAGDSATDFNYYTKRTLLGGVYSTTLLTWLNDSSEDHEATWAFLDRRIGDVMTIEKVKQRWQARAGEGPSLSRFLGRLRHPPR